MKINKLKLQYITILMAFLMLPMTLGPVNADVIPVIPLNETVQSFSPYVMQNHSYYIVPSNYNALGATYYGNDTDVSYTTNSNTATAIGYSTTTGLSSGNTMPTGSVTSETRTVSNPFVPSYSVPVLVNVSEKAGSIQYQNVVPFSIHMGQSSTIFFNQSLTYYALINTTSPFFLNVQVINPNEILSFNLSQTLYPSSTYFNVADKLSIPIIPLTNGLQAIKIVDGGTAQNSLVTFTPMPFDASSFGQTQVPEGQYYSGTVQQGACYNIQSTPVYDTVLKTLSLKFFQFPVQADNTYQLYFYKNKVHDGYDNSFYTCPTGGLSASRIDQNGAFNYVKGSVSDTTNGLIINAKTNGFLNVSLIGAGYLNYDYGFYFRKNANLPIPQQHDLVFNKPVSIAKSPNSYYTFTLQKPSMLAINYTSTKTISPQFYWSMMNPTTQEYQYVINYPSSSSSFNLEQGNLLNDSSTDLLRNQANNVNWVYLPAGQYKLELNGTNTEYATFEFNLKEVQTFSSSISLTMSPNSVYAVELPYDPINYNYINISTTAHDNLSVNYNYAIVQAYSFLGSSDPAGAPIESSIQLGNYGAGSIWNANPANQSVLFSIVQETRMNYKPILLITPQWATFNNGTNTLTASTYSTTIQITSNTRTNLFSGNYNSVYAGSGDHIVGTGSIVNSKQVSVNNDFSTANGQIYAFALTTTPETLYNLTVSINGNYTVNSLNATIAYLWVHSGVFYDAHVWSNGGQFSSQGIYTQTTNTTQTRSLAFMAMSTESYLFINVNRVSGRNATMNINLNNMNVKKLTIQSTNTFNWNSTISALEVPDTTPLWNITNYHYPGSGGLDLVPLAIIGGGVVVVAAVVGGGYYFLKKRGKHP